jgi:hypothetical protein
MNINDALRASDEALARESAQLPAPAATLRQTDNQFMRGLDAGALGLGSSLMNAGGLVAGAVGADDAARSLQRGGDALAADAQRQGPRVGSFSQLRDEGFGLRNSLDYVAGTLGSTIPSMAIGVGAGLGARTLASGLGRVTAAYAPMEVGDAAAGVRDGQDRVLTGEETLRAGAAGLGSAAVGSLVPAMVGGQLTRGAASVGRAGPTTLRSAIGRNALEAPLEGATEAAGDALKQVAANPDAPLDQNQLLDSFVGGTVGGGAFAGLGAAGEYAHANVDRATGAIGRAGGAVADAGRAAGRAVTGAAERGQEALQPAIDVGAAASRDAWSGLEKAGKAIYDGVADSDLAGSIRERLDSTKTSVEGFLNDPDLPEKVRAEAKRLADKGDEYGKRGVQLWTKGVEKAKEGFNTARQSKAFDNLRTVATGLRDEGKSLIDRIAKGGSSADPEALATAGPEQLQGMLAEADEADQRTLMQRVSDMAEDTGVPQMLRERITQAQAVVGTPEGRQELAEAIRETDAFKATSKVVDKLRGQLDKAIGTVKEKTGTKRSEDYSAVHDIIMNELAPHVPESFMTDPQARDTFATQVRRFIELAGRRSGREQRGGDGSTGALRDMSEGAQLNDVHESLVELLGSEAEDVLGNIYRAVNTNADPDAMASFFSNIGGMRDSGTRYSSFGDAIRKNYAGGRQLSNAEVGEYVSGLTKWAREGMGTTGPARQSMDRQVQALLDQDFGKGAPTIRRLLEQEMKRIQKPAGETRTRAATESEADDDIGDAEADANMAEDSVRDIDTMYVGGARGQSSNNRAARGVLSGADGEPGIEGILRSPDFQKSSAPDKATAKSATEGLIKRMQNQYPGHTASFVNLNDYLRQVAGTSERGTPGWQRAREALNKQFPDVANVPESELGTYGYVKLQGRATDDEGLSPADLRAVKLDTASWSRSKSRLEFKSESETKRDEAGEVSEVVPAKSFRADAVKLTRQLDKSRPYNESDDNSRAHRLGRMFMEGYSALSAQYGVTEKLDPDMVIGYDGKEPITVAQVQKLNFRPNANKKGETSRGRERSDNELRTREMLPELNDKELTSLYDRTATMHESRRERMEAEIKAELRDGPKMSMTEWKKAAAALRAEKTKTMSLDKLQATLDDIAYEQTRREGDTTRDRVVNTDGESQRGIRVREDGYSDSGIKPERTDADRQIIDRAGAPAAVTATQLRAVTNTLAELEARIENATDPNVARGLRTRANSLERRQGTLAARDAASIRGADMGSGRTEVGKDEQVHTAAATRNARDLEHRVNMDGSLITYGGDSDLSFNNKAAVRDLRSEIASLEARPRNERDDERLANLQARAEELTAQHGRLTPKGYREFRGTFDRTLGAWRDRAAAAVGNMSNADAKKREMARLDEITERAKEAAAGARWLTPPERDKLMQAFSGTANLRGDQARMVAESLTKEGSPDPKAVAAKKAAFLTRAASGDQDLLSGIAVSSDVKGMRRAFEALADQEGDGFAATREVLRERIRALTQDPDVAYSMQTPQYNTGPVDRQPVLDYVGKVLGNTVATEFADILHAGEFTSDQLGDVIRLSVHSLNPMDAAYHESAHAFFKQLRTTGNQEVANVVMTTAMSQRVQDRLRELLKGQSAALRQLRDPEEAAAYMFQFHQLGQLEVAPKARTVLERIAQALRKLVGVWSNDARALHILDYFSSGKYATQMKNPRAVAQATLAPGRNSAIDALQAIGEPLSNLGSAVFSAGSARLRDSGIPSLLQIAKAIKAEQGERGDPGFIPAARQRSTTELNKFGDVLGGLSQEQMADVLESLQTKQRAATPEARIAVKGVQKLLRQQLSYMTSRGVDVGDLGKDYFPRVWDAHYISKNQQRFEDMLKRAGVTDPERTMQSILASDGNEFGVVVDQPGMQFRKERRLTNVPDAEAAEFLSKDLWGTLQSYVNQAARRAEWAVRFGDDSRGYRDLMNSARAEGATEAQLEVARNFARGVNGTLGDTLDPTIRRLMGNAIVYQNIRLLPLAIFSSVVDPMGILVRGGEVGEAWGAFVRGIKEIPMGLKGKGTNDSATQLAMMLGTVENAAIAHELGSAYGQGMTGNTARKINDTFFRFNLMEGFNRSMRVAATEAAISFIQRHAKGGDPHSARWMRELNLSPSDVRSRPDGTMVLSEAEGLSPKQALRVRTAINRWVDGAVLRPDAADKPIWMNDPRFALFAHLKQFVYAFHHTILKRVMHEARNGNYRPAMALASYVPIMIAADAAKGLITGGGDEPEWKKNWGVADYVANGIQRAGLLGVGQFGVDALNDTQRGGLGFTALAGPTIEQITQGIEVIGGRREFGSFALKSMPANALYAEIVD